MNASTQGPNGPPHGPYVALALVGIGKIARDEHLPSIARNSRFHLAASASRNATLEGVETFKTLEAMLAECDWLNAVALCTPPQVRYRMARAALEAGKHVLLEKPPGVTLSEVADLAGIAQERGVTLFATWHSRFAASVEAARSWLSDKTLRSVRVTWKEDVTHWHPGQEWIWRAGGLGVFDPGINALSILTTIMPHPVFLTESVLSFPENRETPIAADLVFSDAAGSDISAAFDWRQKGPQTWDIEVVTESGTLTLSEGGSVMTVDGGDRSIQTTDTEYDGVYARFADLIAAGESEVDTGPLRHVADAFMLGRRVSVEPFAE